MWSAETSNCLRHERHSMPAGTGRRSSHSTQPTLEGRVPDDEGLLVIPLRGEGDDVVRALQLRERVRAWIPLQLHTAAASLAVNNTCKGTQSFHIHVAVAMTGLELGTTCRQAMLTCLVCQWPSR